MESRRDFLKASAGALTVAAAKPLLRWQGANDRLRMEQRSCVSGSTPRACTVTSSRPAGSRRSRPCCGTIRRSSSTSQTSTHYAPSPRS